MLRFGAVLFTFVLVQPADASWLERRLEEGKKAVQDVGKFAADPIGTSVEVLGHAAGANNGEIEAARDVASNPVAAAAEVIGHAAGASSSAIDSLRLLANPTNAASNTAVDMAAVAANVVINQAEQMAGMADESVFHGEYCGMGNHSGDFSRAPVDRLDAACRDHDRCWDIHGRGDLACNVELVAAATEIATTPSTSTELRAKAANVALFFSNASVPADPGVQRIVK